jgi:RNA-binding protein YhbY
MQKSNKIGDVQLGKNKVTPNFLSSLNNLFKNHENIHVHVLKNARADGQEGREEVRKYAQEILSHLGEKYTASIIGFVIKIKKWRKPTVSKRKI